MVGTTVGGYRMFWKHTVSGSGGKVRVQANPKRGNGTYRSGRIRGNGTGLRGSGSGEMVWTRTDPDPRKWWICGNSVSQADPKSQ